MADVVLRPGRDRSVRRRHPWVLSGAVERLEGEAPPGAEVAVRSAEGEVLGHGHWSPASQIRVRLFDFGKEPPPHDWLPRRVEEALGWRRGHPLLAGTDALRLVNAEGDGLPGLVVDRYADVVVLRASSAGMLVRREPLAEILRAQTGAATGFARDDAVAARREGLAPHTGPLWGELPEEPVAVREGGRVFRVDVRAGQKTGFYLDQRDARALVAALASGRRVLDLFAYTGGFATAAASGGAAAVVAVESSREAAARAEAHLAPWRDTVAARVERADAFRWLRATQERFDLVVLDPPPLARRAPDVPRAARAYKDLLLHALAACDPGALVLAFACSHHVTPELFRKIAFGASLDAGRPAQVLRTLEAPVDHAIALDHPEGRYLTGLLLRVP